LAVVKRAALKRRLYKGVRISYHILWGPLNEAVKSILIWQCPSVLRLRWFVILPPLLQFTAYHERIEVKLETVLNNQGF